jgi:hypothetical protein
VTVYGSLPVLAVKFKGIVDRPKYLCQGNSKKNIRKILISEGRISLTKNLK